MLEQKKRCYFFPLFGLALVLEYLASRSDRKLLNCFSLDFCRCWKNRTFPVIRCHEHAHQQQVSPGDTCSVITRLLSSWPSPISFCVSSASRCSRSAWKVRFITHQLLLLQSYPSPYPSPPSLLLLAAFLRKSSEFFDFSSVDGSLDDAADAGLVLPGEAQHRRCDGIHVSLVPQIQLNHVVLLLLGTFVLLLKVNDVLDGDLRVGRKTSG